MVNLQKIQKASEIILSYYKSEYSSEEYKNTPSYEISELISEDIATQSNYLGEQQNLTNIIYSLSDMEYFTKNNLSNNLHLINDTLTQKAFEKCIETILKFQ